MSQYLLIIFCQLQHFCPTFCNVAWVLIYPFKHCQVHIGQLWKFDNCFNVASILLTDVIKLDIGNGNFDIIIKMYLVQLFVLILVLERFLAVKPFLVPIEPKVSGIYYNFTNSVILPFFSLSCSHFIKYSSILYHKLLLGNVYCRKNSYEETVTCGFERNWKVLSSNCVDMFFISS